MNTITRALTDPFVTPAGAKALKQYDYHGVDQSLIVKYYRPFWNFLVPFIPSSFSPNVVTTMGFFTLFLGLPILLIAGPQPWVFTAYAILLFFYQTFDALDGMQGKKVGMYTHATTELFDHGVDSAVLAITIVISATGLHIMNTWMCPVFVFCSVAGFYLPSWENLNTGTMFFRGGFSNPTEGLAMTQFMFLMTGFFPNMWTLGIFGFELRHILVVVAIVSTAMAAYTSITTVQEHEAKAKAKPFNVRLLGLVPLGFSFVLSLLWALQVHNSAAFHSNLFVQVMSVFTITLPWNYSVLHIIVSEITKTSMDIYRILLCMTPGLIPLIGLYLGFLQIPVVVIGFAVSLAIYLFTVHKVTAEIIHSMGMEHFWTIQHDGITGKSK